MFPTTFDAFYADILEVIQGGRVFESLVRGNPNEFKIENDIIRVKTDKSSPKFLEVDKEYFIRVYDKLLKDRELTRKEMHRPLKIHRSSAVSILISKLRYIGSSTKPIRFWIR